MDEMYVSQMRVHVFVIVCILLCCPCKSVATRTTERTIEKTAAVRTEEMFQDMFPLTSDNFTQVVLRRKDPWIVIFHDGTIEKAWKTMATHIRGLCWVGLVDVTKEHDLLEEMHHESSAEVARVYLYGDRLSKERGWRSVRTQNEAQTLALGSLPDRIHRVQSERIQHFLLEAFSSVPTKFPVYIITEDDTPSATFRALSLRFEQYFLFGLVTRPSARDIQRIGLGDNYISLPAIITIVTENGQPDKISAIKYDMETYGTMTYTKVMSYLFAVNAQFRHGLPGENKSNKKKVAEMSDVLKIEGERFELFNNQSTKKESNEDANKPKAKSNLKMTSFTNKDEL